MKSKKEQRPGIQLRLRVEPEDRDAIQREADRRGVSFHFEAIERLKSGTVMRALSEGEFGMGDFMRFREYVQVVKFALQNAGADPEQWLDYAKFVPFPYVGRGPDGKLNQAAFDEVMSKVKAAIEREPLEAAERVAKFKKQWDAIPAKDASRLPAGMTRRELVDYYDDIEIVQHAQQKAKRADALLRDE